MSYKLNNYVIIMNHFNLKGLLSNFIFSIRHVSNGFFNLLYAALSIMLLIFFTSSGFYIDNENDVFKVGIGQVDITPPVGYPQQQGTSTGVGTPVYAKAIAFKQRGSTGVLLMCDILNIPRDLSRIVREKASAQTGIPYQNISISATHIHTGPKYDNILHYTYLHLFRHIYLLP